jgi:phospholipid/cholesterol/gamma-HCH transport system permease protein
MNALQTWLTLRGQGFSERFNAWMRVFQFAVTAIVGVLSPSTYNKATRLIVQKQIYFTAWQILPGFAAFAALFSFLIIEIVGTTARMWPFARKTEIKLP